MLHGWHDVRHSAIGRTRARAAADEATSRPDGVPALVAVRLGALHFVRATKVHGSDMARRRTLARCHELRPRPFSGIGATLNFSEIAQSNGTLCVKNLDDKDHGGGVQTPTPNRLAPALRRVTCGLLRSSGYLR